jgi:hypothetical protein
MYRRAIFAMVAAILPAPMHLRRSVYRFIAGVLTLLWGAAGVLVLTGYRTGGAGDLLVGLSALLPASVAAAGIIWPPAAATRRDSRAEDPRIPTALGWVGILSALVLAPSVAGLAGNLSGSPIRPLVPSAETAYGFVLALAGTCLFSAAGIARAILRDRFPTRGGLVLGGALALVLTLAGTASFAGAALLNDAALRAQSEGERWGPVDPSLSPPRCSEELATGPSAEVGLTATARVDSAPAGGLSLAGVRSGDAERWEAPVDAHRVRGQFEYVRIPPTAWRRTDGGPWSVVQSGEARATLDTAVADALTPSARASAEEIGIEEVGGARARHCRAAVDGPIALRAVPALRWLIGGTPFDTTPQLDLWRGEIDWWVFADRQLGIASVTIHGPAFGGDWPVRGFQVTLEARLTALDRGQPQVVTPPLP